MGSRKTARNQESILLLPPDIDKLRMFVNCLNTDFYELPFPTIAGWVKVKGDYRPVKQELRRLVQAWFDSGPNVQKLFSADPSIARHALGFRAHLIPTKTPRAKLVYLTVPENLPPGDIQAIALGLFFDFLLNPFNEKLGGPCAHCHKFYIKKTKRQTVYCSKKCGLKHTSQAVIRKHRQDEQERKLKRAKRFSEKWADARTSKGWKQWVSEASNISKNWLTRTVKSGELIEPTRSPFTAALH